MKVSQLKQAIRISLSTGRPLMIWGKPGIGKSVIVAEVLEEAGYDMTDWRLCLMDSVDLRGIPCVRDGLTYWNPPAELPRKEAGKKQRPMGIFMDELPQAAIATTNAASQLILDRKLASYTLPDDARMIAAGNREEDRATAQRMPTHIANRFDHVTLDVDAVEWLLWAQAPSKKLKGQSNIDARVFAFIKYRPKLLHTFDVTSKEKAFASPRSWEFVSDKLRAMVALSVKLDHEQMVECFAGNVGQAPATEFAGFLKIMNQLVDMDAIMLTPDKASVPSDPTVVYALVYALLDRSEAKTFDKIMIYVNRIPGEYQYLYMKEIRDQKQALMKSKSFIDWAVKHQDFA
jgi:hypothetical protein